MQNTVNVDTKSDIINFIIFKRKLQRKLLIIKRAILFILFIVILSLFLYHKGKFVKIATFVSTTLSRAVNEVFFIKINKTHIRLSDQTILDKSEINAIIKKIENSSFNRKKMQEIIVEAKKSNPLIENIVIRRIVATGEMIVSVKEKKILAVLYTSEKNEDNKKMITFDNKIVPYHTIKNSDKIIKIYGNYNETINLQKIVAFFLKYKLNEKIDYCKFYKSGRFDIVLTNGLVVKLPRKHWEKAVMKFIRIDGDYLLSADNNGVEYIDLRTDKMIAKTK